MNKTLNKAKYWLQRKRNLLDYLYHIYFKHNPRPNFNDEEVEFQWISSISVKDGVESEPIQEKLPWFTRINPLVAQKNGWVGNSWEYKFLAGMMFAKRFPNHPYSQKLRESLPEFTDEVIEKWGNGESLVTIIKEESGDLRFTFGARE